MKLHEVTQRMLEQYEEHRYELAESAEEAHSVARFNRCMIEAARDAEMATDLPDDLLDLLPWQVRAFSEQIAKHVEDAKSPPDLKN